MVDYYTKEEMNSLFYRNEKVNDLLKKKQDKLDGSPESPEQTLKSVNNINLLEISDDMNISVLTEHQSLEDYLKLKEAYKIINNSIKDLTMLKLEYVDVLPDFPDLNTIYCNADLVNLDFYIYHEFADRYDWKKLITFKIDSLHLDDYVLRDSVEQALMLKQNVLTDEGPNKNLKKVNGQSVLGKGNIEIPVFEQVQADWNASEYLDDESKNPAYIKNKPILPTKLSELINDDKYITSDELTENYPDKDTVEKLIKEKVDSFNQFKIEKIDKFIDTPLENVIYLLDLKDGNNHYDIYVFVNNTWIKLGTTNINYSDYALKKDIDLQLHNYVLKEKVEESSDRYKVLSDNNFTDDYLSICDNYEKYQTDDERKREEIENNINNKISKDKLITDMEDYLESEEHIPSTSAIYKYLNEQIDKYITKLNGDNLLYGTKG